MRLPVSDKTVLYISYNGIREPLVHSQVLNYIFGLIGYDYRFILLTFEREPLSVEEITTISADLKKKNISWESLPCCAGLKPLATWLDVLRGAGYAAELCNTYSVVMIHARSLVPALIAQKIKNRFHIPYLYDIRGFWIDEKTYKGSMRQGSVVYRLAKSLEAGAYKSCDAIVSLTDTAITEIRKFPFWGGKKLPPFATIPTCVNLEDFTCRMDRLSGPITFGYVGSLGRGYLAEELFDYFKVVQVHFPDSRLLIITRTDHKWLLQLAQAKEIFLSSIEIKTVQPKQVPAEVQTIDVGLSFIEPHYSKKASCPTKLGEYLAVGIPVVANSNIGDMNRVITENRVGVILDDFSAETVEKSLLELKKMIRSSTVSERCVDVAQRLFSLKKGIDDYHALYQKILANSVKG